MISSSRTVPCCAQFEFAGFGSYRSRITPLVSEELGFEQIAGQCRAIYLQEFESGPDRQFVNQTGGRIFSTALLSQDKYGDTRLRQQFGLCPQLAHDRTCAHEECIVADLLDVLTRKVHRYAVTLRIQLASNHALQVLVIDRPNQKFLGTQANGFIFSPCIVRVRKQDDGQIGTKSAQPTQDVQAISIPARQIEQKQIRGKSFLHKLHCFPTAFHRLQLPGVSFPDRPERTNDGGLFADDQQAHRVNGAFRDWIRVHFGDTAEKGDIRILERFDVVSLNANG